MWAGGWVKGHVCLCVCACVVGGEARRPRTEGDLARHTDQVPSPPAAGELEHAETKLKVFASSVRRCLLLCGPTALRHCLLPCGSTAIAVKALPLPCVPTAFVCKTQPVALCALCLRG